MATSILISNMWEFIQHGCMAEVEYVPLYTLVTADLILLAQDFFIAIISFPNPTSVVQKNSTFVHKSCFIIYWQIYPLNRLGSVICNGKTSCMIMYDKWTEWYNLHQCIEFHDSLLYYYWRYPIFFCELPIWNKA